MPTNIVINGEGNNAEIVNYLIVFERDKSISFTGLTIISDTFEKRDGKWLIVRYVTRIGPATIEAMKSAMSN